MKDDFPEVLKSIEKVLLADKASPREALQAAYRFGKLDGMLQILEIDEDGKR